MISTVIYAEVLRIFEGDLWVGFWSTFLSFLKNMSKKQQLRVVLGATGMYGLSTLQVICNINAKLWRCGIRCYERLIDLSCMRYYELQGSIKLYQIVLFRRIFQNMRVNGLNYNSLTPTPVWARHNRVSECLWDGIAEWGKLSTGGCR